MAPELPVGVLPEEVYGAVGGHQRGVVAREQTFAECRGEGRKYGANWLQDAGGPVAR